MTYFEMLVLIAGRGKWAIADTASDGNDYQYWYCPECASSARESVFLKRHLCNWREMPKDTTLYMRDGDRGQGPLRGVWCDGHCHSTLEDYKPFKPAFNGDTHD